MMRKSKALTMGYSRASGSPPPLEPPLPVVAGLASTSASDAPLPRLPQPLRPPTPLSLVVAGLASASDAPPPRPPSPLCPPPAPPLPETAFAMEGSGSNAGGIAVNISLWAWAIGGPVARAGLKGVRKGSPGTGRA